MEILDPKPMATHPGNEIIPWARRQLELASDILDNPGGGLLFATQTMGQVKAGLHERDPERWERLVEILNQAEDSAVRREFKQAHKLLSDALSQLS